MAIERDQEYSGMSAQELRDANWDGFVTPMRSQGGRVPLVGIFTGFVSAGIGRVLLELYVKDTMREKKIYLESISREKVGEGGERKDE